MGILKGLLGGGGKNGKNKSDYEKGFDDGLWFKNLTKEQRTNREYMRGYDDGFDEGIEEDNDFL